MSESTIRYVRNHVYTEMAVNTNQEIKFFNWLKFTLPQRQSLVSNINIYCGFFESLSYRSLKWSVTLKVTFKV